MKHLFFSLLATAVVFTGCQNYEDEIEDLQDQVNALSQADANLSSLLSQAESAVNALAASLQQADDAIITVVNDIKTELEAAIDANAEELGEGILDQIETLRYDVSKIYLVGGLVIERSGALQVLAEAGDGSGFADLLNQVTFENQDGIGIAKLTTNRFRDNYIDALYADGESGTPTAGNPKHTVEFEVAGIKYQIWMVAPGLTNDNFIIAWEDGAARFDFGTKDIGTDDGITRLLLNVLRGQDGARGATGPAGSQGAQGPQGVAGDDGDDGQDGDDGEDGGLDATLSDWTPEFGSEHTDDFEQSNSAEVVIDGVTFPIGTVTRTITVSSNAVGGEVSAADQTVYVIDNDGTEEEFETQELAEAAIESTDFFVVGTSYNITPKTRTVTTTTAEITTYSAADADGNEVGSSFDVETAAEDVDAGTYVDGTVVPYEKVGDEEDVAGEWTPAFDAQIADFDQSRTVEVNGKDDGLAKQRTITVTSSTTTVNLDAKSEDVGTSATDSTLDGIADSIAQFRVDTVYSAVDPDGNAVGEAQTVPGEVQNGDITYGEAITWADGTNLGSLTDKIGGDAFTYGSTGYSFKIYSYPGLSIGTTEYVGVFTVPSGNDQVVGANTDGEVALGNNLDDGIATAKGLIETAYNASL